MTAQPTSVFHLSTLSPGCHKFIQPLVFSLKYLEGNTKLPKPRILWSCGKEEGCVGEEVGVPKPCVTSWYKCICRRKGQRLTELGSCPCSATDRPWPSLGHTAPLYQLQWPGRRLCSRVSRAQGSVQCQHSQILYFSCSGASITRWLPLETLWLTGC